ncbi:CDP-alcohol phosphatidyltransferase family protein [candidate division CSSED10-310 bacterium]|uniref:CDP-alcohol phosphatidyltransferase family protein n=1 Tax=candidate division CSSED10-310 bacterium TaxID=2855610 RepID=A0ABV6Z0Q1_UNCC1
MTISNKLTLLRLCFGPLFWLFFLAIGSIWALFIAFAIIVATEVSDLLDGYFARKRGEGTDFGKLLDPFADSVSRYSYFLCFTGYDFVNGPSDAVPIILVLLIFYRDATVSFLRSIAAGQSIIVAARKSGKIKAIIQAIANHIIVASVILQKFFPTFPDGYIAFVMMVIVTLYTVWSAYDYVSGNIDVIRRTNM